MIPIPSRSSPREQPSDTLTAILRATAVDACHDGGRGTHPVHDPPKRDAVVHRVDHMDARLVDPRDRRTDGTSTRRDLVLRPMREGLPVRVRRAQLKHVMAPD